MTLPPRPNFPNHPGQPPYPGAVPPMYGAPLPPLPPPKSNAGLIIGIIAGVLVLVAGVCVAGVLAFGAYRHDRAASYAEDQGPLSAATRDDTYAAPTTKAAPTTPAAPPPAPARVGDCIVVDEAGAYLGPGNCNGTQGTYKVLSVDYSRDTCADSQSPYLTESGYRLCLELYLVRTFCYKFPSGPGWVVAASACKAKGTVHVIDIVPGAANGNNCTRDLKWNRWYQFTHPTVVYCVMQY
ncbi:hypothetical protein [Dactylosporangium matsuzakiense]|uniref:Uncharacterized protein n=1 Tax=Dactylosporangium matsuzakiense TaxID=53360 RepID=A0A9W6KD73_9ACTN|nr:hypothetical protein [Dactylosporangium matsuzakiense]UWZ45294.1 hypothetical protein Dmats_01705 [Dactylosporangium matsuzakiense]GLK98731.1 hypothetical protein GCM10017581_004720 [Dactylosporangium matsuzakiense]